VATGSPVRRLICDKFIATCSGENAARIPSARSVTEGRAEQVSITDHLLRP
jgi:hypothetical protein